eukprot:COSAG01_NODE_1224_length_11142_cov_72.842615_12_plen_1766_part_00
MLNSRSAAFVIVLVLLLLTAGAAGAGVADATEYGNIRNPTTATGGDVQYAVGSTGNSTPTWGKEEEMWRRQLQLAAQCVPGHHYNSSAGACTACAPGYYQPVAGQSSCIECGAGSYSAGPVLLSEWPLLTDRYCGRWRSGAIIHTYPAYSPDAATFEYMKASALAACMLDEACLSIGLQVTNGGGRIYTTCRQRCRHTRECNQDSSIWGPGSGNVMYMRPLINIGSIACASCPASKYQPYGSGGTHAFDATHADDRSDCLPCVTAGTAAAICGDTVSDCVVGHRYDASTGACTACAPGYYQPAMGQSSCIECSAGSYSQVNWTLRVDRSSEFCDSIQRFDTVDAAFSACEADAACLWVSKALRNGEWLCGGRSDSGHVATCRNAVNVTARVPNNVSLTWGEQLSCVYMPEQGISECLGCPAGTYQPYGTGGAHAFDAAHLDDSGDCQSCPQGQTSSAGLVSAHGCTCAPGSFRLHGGGCRACAPGSAQPAIGQSSCVQCRAGKFSMGSVQLSEWRRLQGRRCNPLFPSPLSAHDRVTSGDIPRLSFAVYATAADAMTACWLDTACHSVTGTGGSWSACGSSSATRSNQWVYAPPSTSAGSATCTSCPVGTYQPYGIGGTHAFDGTRADGASDCIACAKGYHQPEVGQSSCIECGAGNYSVGELSSWVQLPGYCWDSHQGGRAYIGRYPTASDAVAACKIDNLCLAVVEFRHQNGSRDVNWRCNGTKGYQSDWSTCSVQSSLILHDQHSGGLPCDILHLPPPITNESIGSATCTSCPAGTYQPYSGRTHAFGAHGASNCIPCAAGYYQPAAGQSSCIECGAGMYSAGPVGLSGWSTRMYSTSSYYMGSISRMGCDVFRYSDIPNADSDNPQHGTYGAQQGMIGAYGTEAEAVAACWADVTCSTVLFYYNGHDRRFGAAADGARYHICSMTPNIDQDPTLGSLDQLHQHIDTSNQDVGGTLNQDSIGFTRPRTSIGSIACASCPAGKYQPYGSGGTHAFDAAHVAAGCQQCPAGYYQLPHSGANPQINCTGCSFQTVCAECSAGKYSSTVSSASCTSCPAGKYQPYGSGGTHAFDAAHVAAGCQQCPAGYYQLPHSGANPQINCTGCSFQTVCAECSAGKYSSTVSSASCTSCPAGKIQPYGDSGARAFAAEHANDPNDCFDNCSAGFSVNNHLGGCVACPFPDRCLAGSICSTVSTGNLCGSCVEGYYSAGQFCVRCADSPWTTVIVAAIGLALVAFAIWKLSKPQPYTPPSTLDLAEELANSALEFSEASDEFRENVTAISRDAHMLVASVVWPHFTFSLLPLMLPHVPWPSFLTDAAKWFRSLAFLDIGVFANPECFKAAEESAKKSLIRLGLSNGGFWAVLAVFSLVRCAGKFTTQRKVISQRAVNSTVFAFILAYGLLLKSCLGVLHCVENTSSDDSTPLAASSNISTSPVQTTYKYVGRVQSDPDTACDLRTTWLLIWIMLAFLWSFAMFRRYHKWSTRRNHIIKQLIGWLPAMVQIARVCFWPEATLSTAEYQLPALGTLGIVVYGLIIPGFLYHKVQNVQTEWRVKNIENQRLHDADFRARYGYLISRFKPGKWGSEFRILARKSALLLVTTVFAERNALVIPAQLVTLSLALAAQCQEVPFAEVGSKVAAFERHTPTGWSRGDVLEALSLSCQIGITVLSFLSVHFLADTAKLGATNTLDPVVTPTNASSTEAPPATISQISIVITGATLVFMLLPAFYGFRIQKTEWRVGRQNKRRLAPSDTRSLDKINNPTSMDYF